MQDIYNNSHILATKTIVRVGKILNYTFSYSFYALKCVKAKIYEDNVRVYLSEK